MKEQKQTYLVVCSAPGKKGAAHFQTTDPVSGRTLDFYVEFNKPVQVPKWVYDNWVNSYWNEDREKSKALRTAESHIVAKDEYI